MKYKRIGSAIRNFGHSFVSLMNYVDDEYIIDLLPELLRDLPGGTLTISFPTGNLEPDADYPIALRKSVAYWASSFPDHLRREGVDPGALVEAYLVLSLSRGLRCEARATDDRGGVHSVFV